MYVTYIILLYNQRPFGISIIAIFMMAGGIITILAGVISIVAASLGFPVLVKDDFNLFMLDGDAFIPAQFSISGTAFFKAVVAFIGSIILAVGIASLLLSVGTWNGRYWAWIINVILFVSGFVFSALSLAVSNLYFYFENMTGPVVENASFVGILSINIPLIMVITINSIILYYLYKSSVKSFFVVQPQQR